MIKSRVTRQWALFTRGKSFLQTLLAGPVPALAAVAALTSTVSVTVITRWDSGGLWVLHPGPWALRMSERSGRCFWLRWPPRQRKGPSRDKTAGTVCLQSPAVTPLPPFSLEELESQVRCLEKEAAELQEAVEQQKGRNNVSTGRVCTWRRH